MHTICSTQYAHNMHTEQDTEQHTIQNTQNSTQPQRTEHSTYDLHTYSFDLYHEQIYIKNSNTIELYTILNE